MAGSPWNEAAVRAALDDFKDPESGRPVTAMEQVHSVAISGGRVIVKLGLTTWSAPLWKETQENCRRHLAARLPGAQVEVDLAVQHRPPQKLGQVGLPAKTVLAVGSGKGGVGKSTVSAALAYGLQRYGAQVGLMDADVYGPSIPRLVGRNERAEMADGKIRAVDVDGMKVMSMGFLVPPGEAVVWRGPMLHGAIVQFLRDTAWGELDYLIIDMPPGTGDIALTLSQTLPLTGAVVVCTPQDVALIDAVKAIAMFRKVGIPLCGLVENMSTFLCPSCGQRHDLFGHGGARRHAEGDNIPFLGEIPLQMPIRVNGDAGRIAGYFDDAASAPYFDSIVRTLVSNLSNSRRERPPLPTLSVLK
jgi:ATP-binding protein involved in chromosome partitioning